MVVPEDWIGQQISLGTDLGPSATIVGTLEEVSDRGVVVEHELVVDDLQDGEVVSVFYPWRIVLWLYPHEEHGSDQQRPRPTGMPTEILEVPLP